MPLEYELQPDNNLMIIRVIGSFCLDEFEKTMHVTLYDKEYDRAMAWLSEQALDCLPV